MPLVWLRILTVCVFPFSLQLPRPTTIPVPRVLYVGSHLDSARCRAYGAVPHQTMGSLATTVDYCCETNTQCQAKCSTGACT